MTLNGLPRHVQDAVHRINTDINLEVLDLTFDPVAVSTIKKSYEGKVLSER